MKQLTMLVLSLSITASLFAQRFDDVKKYFLIQGQLLIPGQLENAKAEVDKLGQNPKATNKAEFWMWKAKMYSYIYKDEAARTKYPGSEAIAKEAYEKYVTMDPQLSFMKENGVQNIISDIYATSFNLGVKAYNTKKWDSALYYFTYAVTFSDAIFKNKLTTSTATFDTTSILMAGMSAQNAQKNNEALKYYSILADAKIAGNEYNSIYQYVLVSYSNKNDSAQFNKYIAIAKEVYPKINWDDYELDFIYKNYSITQKAAFYDKKDSLGTLSAADYIQYGDIFINLSKSDKASLDSLSIIAFQTKARIAFEKAYNKSGKQDAGLPAFNVGIILYNEYSSFDDKKRDNIRKIQGLNIIKSQEKDTKKRLVLESAQKPTIDSLKKENAALNIPLNEKLNASIEWLEKAYNEMKDKYPLSENEKKCLRKSVDVLANLYADKRDMVKGKDPKAYDEYDAKYKLYDSLHGKF